MDLNAMSEKEYLEYIKSNYFVERGKYSLEIRLSVVRQLMKLFKLVENREQLAYVICNKHRIITEACAGAGKTSISLLKVMTHIMFGDVDERKVILMTYTVKSANDLVYRFESMSRVLKSIDLNGLVTPTDVTICTMHSFYNDLIYEYSERFNLKTSNNNLVVLTDVERQAIMRDTVSTLSSKEKIDITIYDGLYSKLLSLYTQIKEKDIYEVPELWSQCSSFKSVSEIYIPDLVTIYDVYEKIKRARKVIELSEYANFSKSILQNDDIRNRWQDMYKMILVDEYQDATQSQVAVLKLLLNIEEVPNSYLFAIGDGDQSIYGFRGAHSNGCYNFPEDFKVNPQDFSRCFMTLNRRCPENILKEARKVIETLNTRIYKDLKSMKEGGYFNISYVDNSMDECNNVISILEGIPEEELADTVIAYRNNRSCRIIKWFLEEKGYKPVSNSEFYDLFQSTLEGCLALLADPYNLDLMKNYLFKMVPKSKDFSNKTIKDLIKEEQERRAQGYPVKPFYSLNYQEETAPSSLRQVLKGLRNMSYCLRDDVDEEYKHLIYLDKIVNVLVFNYIRRYYLEWQDSKTDYEGSERIFDPGSNNLIDPYAKIVYDFYCRHITWKQLQLDIAKRKTILANSFKKVNLCTFHSLKGLEFTNVILIDLRDNIFPGHEITEAQKFGPQFIKEADDEAKRLFYVAITRSKKNLWMLFNKTNPTRYLTYFTESESEEEEGFGFDLMEEEDAVPWDTEITQQFGNFEDLIEDDEDNQIDKVKKSLLNRWLDE